LRIEAANALFKPLGECLAHASQYAPRKIWD
jgi:hypothetical protein